MDTTPNLQLPYIMPAQAQKHVTHNEAIRALDAVVQISVLDRHLAAPPASPADGKRYIVAAAGTGAWLGKDGQVAAFQDGAWAYYAPRPGWLAWVEDEQRLIAWSGTGWIAADGGSLNPAPLIGVNTTAAAPNRLAVKSDAVLFSHDDVTPGNGDIQAKLNKAAADDTASVLLQTAYSGRAEHGLIGDDNWRLKVSADGTTWLDVIVVDRATGALIQPLALEINHATLPALRVTQRGDGHVALFEDATNPDVSPTICNNLGNWVFGGAELHPIGSFTGLKVSVHGTTGGTASFANALYSANVSGPSNLFAKSRSATLATHGIVQNNDSLGAIRAFGSDGAAFVEAARIEFLVDGTPASGDVPARLVITTKPAGGALAQRLRMSAAGDVVLGTGTPVAGIKLDVDGPICAKSYTVSTVPAANLKAGMVIYVSNETGGAVLAFSDGTNWRRVTDRAVIA